MMLASHNLACNGKALFRRYLVKPPLNECRFGNQAPRARFAFDSPWDKQVR